MFLTIDLPIPLVPPVTNTTLPFKLISIAIIFKFDMFLSNQSIFLMYKVYILIGFFISLFIPRTKKIWVFGENELTVLKPFYEFSSIQNDGIKKIYISCDNKRIIDLQSKGFKILSIKDTTPMPHNGARPPKRRRV